MYIKKISEDLIDWYKGNLLNEATGVVSAGSIRAPLTLGTRMWEKNTLQPFDKKLSKYDNSELAHDSYDGKMSTPKNKIKGMERKAKKIEKFIKNHPIQSDDDGDILNTNQGTIKPVAPFTEKLNEDLAVWFGTKKKPKGSKQPKGPWVNICRKKEGGGHPPCGRPEAKSKGYPKCRAAGVASKMTDAQKKSACAQKRRAEKTNPKTGTGNAPKMTSYKPRKESLENKIKNLLREYLLMDGI